MRLRPHHILCIQKFTGHGYDSVFTEHMTEIVSQLSVNPGTKITVTKGCDVLCAMCPENSKGFCNSFEKTTILDNKVLDICNIAYDEEVIWSDIARKAYKRVFETDEFNNICSDCQWFGLCRSREVTYE